MTKTRDIDGAITAKALAPFIGVPTDAWGDAVDQVAWDNIHGLALIFRKMNPGFDVDYWLTLAGLDIEEYVEWCDENEYSPAHLRLPSTSWRDA